MARHTRQHDDDRARRALEHSLEQFLAQIADDDPVLPEPPALAGTDPQRR